MCILFWVRLSRVRSPKLKTIHLKRSCGDFCIFVGRVNNVTLIILVWTAKLNMLVICFKWQASTHQVPLHRRCPHKYLLNECFAFNFVFTDSSQKQCSSSSTVVPCSSKFTLSSRQESSRGWGGWSSVLPTILFPWAGYSSTLSEEQFTSLQHSLPSDFDSHFIWKVEAIRRDWHLSPPSKCTNHPLHLYLVITPTADRTPLA